MRTIEYPAHLTRVLCYSLIRRLSHKTLMAKIERFRMAAHNGEDLSTEQIMTAIDLEKEAGERELE